MSLSKIIVLQNRHALFSQLCHLHLVCLSCMNVGLFHAFQPDPNIWNLSNGSKHFGIDEKKSTHFPFQLDPKSLVNFRKLVPELL